MALSKKAQARNREIQRGHKKQLARVLQALSYATPWALASRFADIYRCVEASHAGAAALRAHGVEARPVLCGAGAFSKSEDTAVFTGLNAEECYEYAEKKEGQAFEDWAKEGTFPETPTPLHMAIRASYHGHRAFVDLTLGQLKKLGAKIPGKASIYIGDDEWPRLESNDSLIKYMRCQHEEKLSEFLVEAPLDGLAKDFVSMMEIALELDLNEEAFVKEMLKMSHALDFAKIGATRDEVLARVQEFLR